MNILCCTHMCMWSAVTHIYGLVASFLIVAAFVVVVVISENVKSNNVEILLLNEFMLKSLLNFIYKYPLTTRNSTESITGKDFSFNTEASLANVFTNACEIKNRKQSTLCGCLCSYLHVLLEYYFFFFKETICICAWINTLGNKNRSEKKFKII